VKLLGHVPSRDHNAFNVTPRCVLNVNRDSMARFGYSPPTRVFEAAGAGACLMSDAWEGLDQFLEPGREVLVARDADDVVAALARLSEPTARAIGRAARRRVLAEHTYEHRARQFEEVIEGRGAAGVAA
jgi:spore maturation protein CgeB